jgi:guanylate kinase/C-terminal processing protease CtpA/Prc
LGLKGGQLFDLTDLQEIPNPKGNSGNYQSRIGRQEQERRLRSVAVTIYWLSRTVCKSQDYSGPHLNLSAFKNIVSTDTEHKRPSSVTAITISTQRVSTSSLSTHYGPGLARYNSAELLTSPAASESGRFSEFGYSSLYSSRESLNLSQQEPSSPTLDSSQVPKPVFTPQITIHVKSPIRSASVESLQSDTYESPPFSPTHSEKDGELLSSTEAPALNLQVIAEEEEKGATEQEEPSAHKERDSVFVEDKVFVVDRAKSKETSSPVEPPVQSTPIHKEEEKIPAPDQEATPHSQETKLSEEDKEATVDELKTESHLAEQESLAKKKESSQPPVKIDTASEVSRQGISQHQEVEELATVEFLSPIELTPNPPSIPSAEDTVPPIDQPTTSNKPSSPESAKDMIAEDTVGELVQNSIERNSRKMSKRRMTITPSVSDDLPKQNGSVSQGETSQPAQSKQTPPTPHSNSSTSSVGQSKQAPPTPHSNSSTSSVGQSKHTPPTLHSNSSTSSVDQSKQAPPTPHSNSSTSSVGQSKQAPPTPHSNSSTSSVGQSKHTPPTLHSNSSTSSVDQSKQAPPTPHSNSSTSSVGQMDVKVVLKLERGKLLGFQLSEETDKEGRYRLISNVTPDSPAASAGMRKSDFLTSVNGQTISRLLYKKVVSILKEASTGDKLELGLCRYCEESVTTVLVPTEPTQPAPLTPPEPAEEDNVFSPPPSSLGPAISVVSDSTSVKPPTAGSQLSLVKASFVRVESDAVPTPQHPKKVVYPSKSDSDVFEPDVTSPLSNSSTNMKKVSTESFSSAENGDSKGSEEQHLKPDVVKGRRTSESFIDSVLKEAVERVRTISDRSPELPAKSEQVEDTKSVDTLLSDEMSIYSKEMNERKMKERERRRQNIDEGAKAYQKYQMNGRRPGSCKSTASVSSPVRLTVPQDLKEDVDKGDNVGELHQNPTKPPRKESAVADILRRLSISLRPLPAFEDDSSCGTKSECVRDGPVDRPLALNVGSDSESGHHVRTEEGSTDKESTVSLQSGKKPAFGYGARIDALLQAIRTIHSKVGREEDNDDLQALEKVIQSSEMRKAIEMDEMMRCLVQGTGPVPDPVDKHAVPASVLFRSALKKHPDSYSEIDELRELMRNPFVQALLFCHDKVATRDFFVPESTPSYIDPAHPDLVAIPSDSLDQLSRDHLYRKDQAKTITIDRSDKPLGMVLQRDDSLNGVFIWQLLYDCDAFSSGQFHEGDEVLEVNGISVSGMSAPQAMKILNGLAGTHMTFSIIPSENSALNVAALEQCFLRAHVDYDPLLDSDHPCRELGLEFRKGDILKVLNQDDSNWWQARIVDELGDGIPGLIPARHMLEKRLALRHTYHGDMEMNKPKKRGIKSLLPMKKKKRKTYYSQDLFQDGSEDITVYEDVVRLSPNPQRKRPIAVIGAPGVGRKTLIKKLIDSNPEKYSTCIPHTSRPMRVGEVNGKDYYFATREQMEKEIRNNHFLEHGEHKGNLYGVSIETVMNLMKLGQVPVLDIHPQSLKLLRSAAMMPYTIFIKAPPMDRLLSTRQVASNKKGKRDSQVFSENELEEIYRLSTNMEAQYSHYFDWIIVNDDLQVASDFLMEMVRRIETEVQWVPASWCEDRPV